PGNARLLLGIGQRAWQLADVIQSWCVRRQASMTTEDFLVHSSRHREQVEQFVGQLPDALAQVGAILLETFLLIAVLLLQATNFVIASQKRHFDRIEQLERYQVDRTFYLTITQVVVVIIAS